MTIIKAWPFENGIYFLTIIWLHDTARSGSLQSLIFPQAATQPNSIADYEPPNHKKV